MMMIYQDVDMGDDQKGDFFQGSVGAEWVKSKSGNSDMLAWFSLTNSWICQFLMFPSAEKSLNLKLSSDL